MNMMKKLVVAGILISLPLAAHAQEQVTLKVSGVVCAFCAQGIKKSFLATGAVNQVAVDLDAHQVSLEMLPDKELSNQEISDLLEKSGFNLISVERNGSSERQG